MKARIPNPRFGTTARPAIAALLGEFESQAELTAQGPHVRRMLRMVRRFLWSERIVDAGDFDAGIIRHYLAGVQAQGRAPKTVRNHQAALSSWCGFLVGRGLLRENPCSGIRLRRAELRPARYLTDREIDVVLRLARRRGISPEVCLALSTGLRLSELIRLAWDDVDVDRRCLMVRRSKSGRFRVVPLCRSALAALELQRDRTGEFAQVFPARQTWRGGWRYVDRMRESSWWLRALRPIQDAVPKFGELAGRCTGRGWHLLRHTFASRLAQRGVSLYKLATWLGHSDVRTTRIYAHLAAGFDEDIEAVSIPSPGRAREGDESCSSSSVRSAARR